MHKVTWGPRTGFENGPEKFAGGNGADAKAQLLIAQGVPVVRVEMGNELIYSARNGVITRPKRQRG